ncbi:MAG: DNA polymerase III subunit gamma/tau, partial [Alphaproteobacteria bacterium]|nr:DNA polymerase III subunit gamma/tau [Alphaproteobacteria bacterium]
MPKSSATPYQVLARKYRPTTFSALIGQEVLVKVLQNAIEKDRLPHAFILTGVRGVGKTTTARLIARAINCVGIDGKGKATINPCGQCDSCKAISEDRHIDVIEMDAASRTGVDDIRDLIEGVHYKPVLGRFKVYIVDEVHMLSKNAFNALLKTLEEPPEHVKFIFATTEIQKVPVTILSRCMRFDLRRIDQKVLQDYFATHAKDEGIEIEEQALALIARAADGSVRDGQSLLDQAFNMDTTCITADHVRKMLGYADKSKLFDLFEILLKGDIQKSLGQLQGLYQVGAEPMGILKSLLDVTHWISKLKISSEFADDITLSETERVRGLELSKTLSNAVLQRTWQMLLKGVGEVSTAPQSELAIDMLFIRLAHVKDIPSVEELKQGVVKPEVSQTPNSTAPSLAQPTVPHQLNQDISPNSFEEVIQLFDKKREALLHTYLVQHVRLVNFQKGRIELRLMDQAPRDFCQKISKFLTEWTGERW